MNDLQSADYNGNHSADPKSHNQAYCPGQDSADCACPDYYVHHKANSI